jgi:NAD(P)H-flavin reductase/hemoglobin-like flavoprotein
MDTGALQDSWKLVAKSGDEVPLFFYSHLFLSHPELREMFPVSMSAQRDKLVGALGTVVSNVERLDEVTPVLQQLGRDHRRFSVVAEHYPAVGASLLATLQYFLGPQWTEPLASEWAAAYGLIAKVMVQAAEEASDDSPSWWAADVVATERRTIDVAVLQIRPQTEFGYLPGQSFALEIPQRPRLWRYFSPANAPRGDGTIELHVQLVAGGQVSTSIVRTLRQNDTVRMGAPVGNNLVHSPDDPRDLLMVAGGTGLSPLRAVLEQIDRAWEATGTAPQIHLFHGARMPWNLYEHQRLTALAQQRPWFEYTPVVSDDSSYPGARGLVGAIAAQSPSRHGRRAMVCGSPAMVRHAVGQLVNAGVAPDEIRYEEFIAAQINDQSSSENGNR